MHVCTCRRSLYCQFPYFLSSVSEAKYHRRQWYNKKSYGIHARKPYIPLIVQQSGGTDEYAN